MAVKIKPLRKFTTGTPTTSDMVEGEIAVNTADKKVFMRDDANNVIEVGAASSLSLPIGGGTLTGDVILNSDSVTLPSFGGGTNEGALQVFTSELMQIIFGMILILMEIIFPQCLQKYLFLM